MFNVFTLRTRTSPTGERATRHRWTTGACQSYPDAEVVDNAHDGLYFETPFPVALCSLRFTPPCHSLLSEACHLATHWALRLFWRRVLLALEGDGCAPPLSFKEGHSESQGRRHAACLEPCSFSEGVSWCAALWDCRVDGRP